MFSCWSREETYREIACQFRFYEQRGEGDGAED